jgi:hypothetical protein
MSRWRRAGLVYIYTKEVINVNIDNGWMVLQCTLIPKPSPICLGHNVSMNAKLHYFGTIEKIPQTENMLIGQLLLILKMSKLRSLRAKSPLHSTPQLPRAFSSKTIILILAYQRSRTKMVMDNS